MGLRISELCINCADPDAMAAFWCAVLGYRETERDDESVAIAGAANAPTILLIRVDDVVPDAKVGHNRLHLDLSPTGSDQDAEVVRLETLGARRIDIGQGTPTWVVMADPEGNEFCVLRRPVPPEPEPFAPLDRP
jgi:catechol 2,3-dioxygenase-like lactoylglutathione lyase family enzyme